jgi:transposase-like protein
MTSKKITAADKLEIVNLYREAGDTTASLAIRYGVSNSTISRLLKLSIPEAEYEMLIQQKRVSKVVDDADDLISIVTTTEVDRLDRQSNLDHVDLAPAAVPPNVTPATATPPSEEDASGNRRLRRRSSAPVEVIRDEPVPETPTNLPIERAQPIITISLGDRDELLTFGENIDPRTINPPIKTSVPAPIPRTPVLRDILADSENRYFTPVVEPSALAEDLEDDEDEDTEDVNVLAAMFGEEIADSEDDDDDDDDDEDEETTVDRLLNPNQLLTEDRLHVQITPLSQATLPRTCYIVIDKFAELIIRPLKDFADLGQISGEETQQRTLPIFDNHRVAKRFSNQRTQRVIKVPDSRIFYKTTQHLKLKGITRLLVDGNIYSLN